MNFPQYPKINAPFMRNMDEPGKPLIVGVYATPEIELLASCRWDATEKVDGTNIRIRWEPETSQVSIQGKTDKAELPKPLESYLTDKFTSELFAKVGFDTPVILYGEGFGGRIQKAGPKYRPDGSVDFALFDVLIGSIWLRSENVVDIAKSLDLVYPANLGKMTLFEAINYVRTRPDSCFGGKSEGVVLRAPEGMLTRMGRRIMTKVKVRDFA